MRVVVDACNAGKDIYCEKPMSHAAEQGFAMVEAAQKNNRIVQIGSQRVSSVLCAKARELYHNGAIGDVERWNSRLGRNSPTGAWEYPPPPGLSPQNLDWDTWLNDAPKIPFDPDAFRALALLEGIRHRRRRRPDGAPDQRHAVHARLERAAAVGAALGGIFRWKDGRNMPDLHVVLFDYHGIPVYVRLGLGTETPELARFMGPKGHSRATGGRIAPLAAARHRYRAQLLLGQLPGEDARRVRAASGTPSTPSNPGTSR